MGGGGELRKVNKAYLWPRNKGRMFSHALASSLCSGATNMLWHKYERIIDATFILVYTNFYSNSIKYSKEARSCLNNQKAICMHNLQKVFSNMLWICFIDCYRFVYLKI